MYDEQTYENILERMLDEASDTFDKREGSPLYIMLAPTAMALARCYMNLGAIYDEGFPDTASRDSLIKHGKDKSIEPFEATYAVVKGVFNMEVPLGWRFTLDDLFFLVTEKIEGEEFTYKLQCEQSGDIGNVSGDLIPVNYLQGLGTAKIAEILMHGEDEEDTENLRERVTNRTNQQAFGGNEADYKDKVKGIQDVGGVKVTPVWQGGGTTKLTITNRFNEVPEPSLIEYVQNMIDPPEFAGKGKGLAPIGHVVTVFGSEADDIYIETKLTLQNDWSWEDVYPVIKEILEEYLDELNVNWEEQDNTIVRISQIETRILNIDGLIDIEGTKINGLEKNYIVEKDKIVRLGSVGEIVG